MKELAGDVIMMRVSLSSVFGLRRHPHVLRMINAVLPLMCAVFTVLAFGSARSFVRNRRQCWRPRRIQFQGRGRRPRDAVGNVGRWQEGVR